MAQNVRPRAFVRGALLRDLLVQRLPRQLHRRRHRVRVLKRGDDRDRVARAFRRVRQGEGHAFPIHVSRDIGAEPFDAVGFPSPGRRDEIRCARSERDRQGGFEDRHVAPVKHAGFHGTAFLVGYASIGTSQVQFCLKARFTSRTIERLVCLFAPGPDGRHRMHLHLGRFAVIGPDIEIDPVERWGCLADQSSARLVPAGRESSRTSLPSRGSPNTI